MKICIDLTSLDDNFSGIERFACSLALELVKKQDTNYVLVFKNKVHVFFEDVIKKNNVDYEIVKGHNKLFFNQIKLPIALKRIKADYYLFMAFPVPIFFSKKKAIATVHDMCCWDCPRTMKFFSSIYFKVSQRIAMKKALRIITISKFTKNRIIEKFQINPERIWLVYCGVDLDKFALKNKGDNIFEKYHLPNSYFLSLSTIEPRKNLGLLINAYQLLNETYDDIPHLVLAGRKGWKVEDLLLGLDSKTKEKICFTGFVEDSDLPWIYNSSIGFIFPSLYEGFGIPPLEALACNSVVLSSDATAMPEVLSDSVMYFESGNIDDLKEKMRLLYNLSADEKAKYLEKGKVIVSKFDWSNEAEKLFNQLVSLK